MNLHANPHLTSHTTQAVFRAALQAMSRPGVAQALPLVDTHPLLGGGLGLLLLALTDADTPVWWQQPEPSCLEWLRFHTGAPHTAQASAAAFAVVTDAAALNDLAGFGQGSDAAPETSTTVLVHLKGWQGGTGQLWHGPGLPTPLPSHLPGLTPKFWSERQAQQAAFPCGVDLLFCCAQAVLGLPRSTQVREI